MSLSQIDCTTCGACCFGTHDRYIAILPEDRGRAIPEHTLNDFDGRRYMRMAGGHCAQLCLSDDRRLVCGIYELRPEACRAFRAGSFECQKARQYRLPLADAMRAGEGAEIVLPPDTPADLPPAHVIDMPAGRRRPRA